MTERDIDMLSDRESISNNSHSSYRMGDKVSGLSWSNKSTVFVGNLPLDVTPYELFTYFRKFGQLNAGNSITLKEGINKKYAFIRFSSAEVAQSVIQLSREHLLNFRDGDAIVVSPCKSKENSMKKSTGYSSTANSSFSLTSDSSASHRSLSIVSGPHDCTDFQNMPSKQHPNDSMNRENPLLVHTNQQKQIEAEIEMFRKGNAIYIGSVPINCEDDLREIFSQYGSLLPRPHDIEVIKCKSGSTSAIVHFLSANSVDLALQDKNIKVQGQSISMLPCRSSSNQKQNRRNASDTGGDATNNVATALSNEKRLKSSSNADANESTSSSSSTGGSFEQSSNSTFDATSDDRSLLSCEARGSDATTTSSETLSDESRLAAAVAPKNSTTTSDASFESRELQRSTTIDGDAMTLRIRNVGKLTSADVLRQYLTKGKRSGGGPLSRFDVDSLTDSALVAFGDSATARRVLKWPKGHIREKHTLFVSILPPICNTRLYINNLPSWVTERSLELYLGYCFLAKIVGIRFSRDEKGAIVEMDREVNFEAAKQAVLVDPLVDSRNEANQVVLSLREVHFPDAVLIHGKVPSEDALTDSLENFLTLKLQNRPEIQTEVRYVVEKEESKDESYSLIIFQDYKVVSMLDDSIAINQTRYVLTPYYDEIGVCTKKDRASFIRRYSDAKFGQPLTPLQFKFLQIPGNFEFVKERLKKCNNWTYYFALSDPNDPPCLDIYASNQNLAENIAQTVKNMLQTTHTQLDADALRSYTQNTGSLGSVLRKISLDDDDVVFEIKDDVLSCVTLDEKKLSKALGDYFGNHVIYNESLTRNLLEYTFLNRLFATDLKVKFESSQKLTLEWSNNELRAKSSRTALTGIRQFVNQILEGKEIRYHTLLRFGMTSYFRGSTGRREMTTIADDCGVIIVDENEVKIDEENISSVNPSIKGCLVDGSFDKLRFLVICDDMVEQVVDGIVNACNEDLDHTGGLAGAIVAKGGHSIQQECYDHVKKNGKVRAGQVFASDPGTLSCRKIIHAVGPRWHGGSNKEREVLKDAVSNCIKTANELQLKSLAIPAISTNIFGFPIDLAVPIIVDACIKAPNASLVEIRFVDLRQNVVREFANYLKKHTLFRTNSIAIAKSAPSLPAVPENELEPEVVALPSPATSKKIKPIKSPLHRGTGLAFNGCAVQLLRGDIVNEARSHDVIVNTTGAHLIDGGTSCKAILAAAGPVLVNDAKAKHPDGIDNRTVGVTAPGDLPCRCIYHLYCGNWHPSTLQHLIESCLDLANASKFTSIAFPCIGTGGLKYPKDQLAKLMLDCFESWLSTARAACTLKKISVVMYYLDVDVIEVFEKEYESRLSGSVETKNQDEPSTSSQSDSINGVQIGTIKVSLIHGDITAESSDVVICPTNSDLSFSRGQVASALLKAAKSGFQEKINRVSKSFESGVLIFPTAEFLPCRNLLFLDVPTDGDDSKLFNIFLEAMKQSNQTMFTTISSPLLGAGNLGRNVEEVIDLMFQVVKKYSARTKGHTNLSHLRIVIHKAADFKIACQYINRLTDGPSRSNSLITSLFEKIGRSIFGMVMPRKQKSTPVKSEETDQSSDQSMTLVIYGSINDINKAQTQLDDFCELKWPERTISLPLIETLDANMIERLKIWGLEFDVDVRASPSQRKIKIRGARSDEFGSLVKEALKQLHGQLESADVDSVNWFKKAINDFTWTPITQNVKILEKAFKEKNLMSDGLDTFEDLKDVTVDFDLMTVSDRSGAILYELKRKLTSDEIPIEWNWQPGTNEDYKLILIDPNSPEYAKVSKAALQTSPNVAILSIERVENPHCYRQYLLQKKRVTDALAGSNLTVERDLFHGTPVSSINSICNGGFDRSWAGVNNVCYGHGSYFARDFKYSEGYGKKIFYCNVLTGRFCVGDSTIKVAPYYDAAKGVKYDSLVNDVNNPCIFVVFSDNHAYPAYLITIA